jgi:hypothetical protein
MINTNTYFDALINIVIDVIDAKLYLSALRLDIKVFLEI